MTKHTFRRRYMIHGLTEADVFWIEDEEEAQPLTIYYTAREGASATWDDPAEAHEFDIYFVTMADPDTGREIEITDAVTYEQLEAWADWLDEHHDFDRYDYYD